LTVTPAQLNAFGRDYLPELFGIDFTSVDGELVKSVTATLKVYKALMAPNDWLHRQPATRGNRVSDLRDEG
jgi:hypothetical protein